MRACCDLGGVRLVCRRAFRAPSQSGLWSVWRAGRPVLKSRIVAAKHDSLAERSKAVAQGAIPKGRGFEPHSCHFLERAKMGGRYSESFLFGSTFSRVFSGFAASCQITASRNASA